MATTEAQWVEGCWRIQWSHVILIVLRAALHGKSSCTWGQWRGEILSMSLVNFLNYRYWTNHIESISALLPLDSPCKASLTCMILLLVLRVLWQRQRIGARRTLSLIRTKNITKNGRTGVVELSIPNIVLFQGLEIILLQYFRKKQCTKSWKRDKVEKLE